MKAAVSCRLPKPVQGTQWYGLPEHGGCSHKACKYCFRSIIQGYHRRKRNNTLFRRRMESVRDCFPYRTSKISKGSCIPQLGGRLWLDKILKSTLAPPWLHPGSTLVTPWLHPGYTLAPPWGLVLYLKYNIYNTLELWSPACNNHKVDKITASLAACILCLGGKYTERPIHMYIFRLSTS